MRSDYKRASNKSVSKRTRTASNPAETLPIVCIIVIYFLGYFVSDVVSCCYFLTLRTAGESTQMAHRSGSCEFKWRSSGCHVSRRSGSLISGRCWDRFPEAPETAVIYHVHIGSRQFFWTSPIFFFSPSDVITVICRKDMFWDLYLTSVGARTALPSNRGLLVSFSESLQVNRGVPDRGSRLRSAAARVICWIWRGLHVLNSNLYLKCRSERFHAGFLQIASSDARVSPPILEYN